MELKQKYLKKMHHGLFRKDLYRIVDKMNEYSKRHQANLERLRVEALEEEQRDLRGIRRSTSLWEEVKRNHWTNNTNNNHDDSNHANHGGMAVGATGLLALPPVPSDSGRMQHSESMDTTSMSEFGGSPYQGSTGNSGGAVAAGTHPFDCVIEEPPTNELLAIEESKHSESDGKLEHGPSDAKEPSGAQPLDIEAQRKALLSSSSSKHTTKSSSHYPVHREGHEDEDEVTLEKERGQLRGITNSWMLTGLDHDHFTVSLFLSFSFSLSVWLCACLSVSRCMFPLCYFISLPFNHSYLCVFSLLSLLPVQDRKVQSSGRDSAPSTPSSASSLSLSSPQVSGPAIFALSSSTASGSSSTQRRSLDQSSRQLDSLISPRINLPLAKIKDDMHLPAIFSERKPRPPVT